MKKLEGHNLWDEEIVMYKVRIVEKGSYLFEQFNVVFRTLFFKIKMTSEANLMNLKIRRSPPVLRWSSLATAPRAYDDCTTGRLLR